MTVEIFIVSFVGDIEYLRWNLKSILKFCSGFSGVTLLVPVSQIADFHDLQKEYGVTLKAFQEAPGKGHIHHQAMECCADRWCPDADFILHTDSDCVFTEPVTPEDYFVDGKPVLCIQRYSTLPPEVPWKSVTENIVRFECLYETMRRHPAVHYRQLYKDTRKHVEAVHKFPFTPFVLTLKPDFPQGISEYNLLGAIALTDKWKHRYHFVDMDSQPAPHSKLSQMWSKAPPNQEQQMPNGGTWKPTDLFNQLGL